METEEQKKLRLAMSSILEWASENGFVATLVRTRPGWESVDGAKQYSCDELVHFYLNPELP